MSGYSTMSDTGIIVTSISSASDMTSSSDTIASNTSIGWNISISDNLLLSVQVALLLLERGDLLSNLGLLSPDLVQVLLLDGLLLDSLLLLLKLESDLLLLDFLKFGLNERIIDFTVLIGLDLLEEGCLLLELPFASAFGCGVGRNVVLRSRILVPQLLGQNGELGLWVQASRSMLLINTCTVTANGAMSTCVT